VVQRALVCERTRRHISEEAMKSLALKVQRFLVSEDGPTAVEYAVMLALIIIVCLTAIQAIGTNANATFNSVAQKIGGS
jgi:pilus assembly protein Flp/PilA